MKVVKEHFQMQLTNSATIVDFYPQAFIVDGDSKEVSIKRFIKQVTFKITGQKSYSTVTASTVKDEIRERVASGAEVTDFHIEKFTDYASYRPLAC